MSGLCEDCHLELETEFVEPRDACHHRFHEECLEKYMVDPRAGAPRDGGRVHVDIDLSFHCPVCNADFDEYVFVRQAASQEMIHKAVFDERIRCKKQFDSRLKLQQQKHNEIQDQCHQEMIKMNLQHAVFQMEVRESTIVEQVLEKLKKDGESVSEARKKQVVGVVKDVMELDKLNIKD